MDSLVPLIHHDPERSWITDPDPDHTKGTQPKYQKGKLRLAQGKQNLRVTCVKGKLEFNFSSTPE